MTGRERRAMKTLIRGAMTAAAGLAIAATGVTLKVFHGSHGIMETAAHWIGIPGFLIGAVGLAVWFWAIAILFQENFRTEGEERE